MEKRKQQSKKIPKQVRFKKSCLFCKKNLEIDYKNLDGLARYISSKGKIVSRRFSGNCAKHQRKLAQEIKRGRFLSLFPYIGR
jgi:small subunit ribosomal protein S18